MSTRQDPPLRQLATEVVRAGDLLWATSVSERASWLADAFALIRRRDSELGEGARRDIFQSSGLSAPMIDWALEQALAPLTAEALIALDSSITPPQPRARRARAGQLCVVVLAGNVFTAAARGVAFPLLFGWPVLAKASSHDDSFARVLESALAQTNPTLTNAYRVTTFGAEQGEHSALLFEQADAVSVYGSDQTLNAIRAQLGASLSFIGHGHGLGAAFVDRAALADEQAAQRAATQLALDVAAYDQRGCLSPHVAWVSRGGHVSPDAFAALVYEALERVRAVLPRGPLPFEVASAQLNWRGVGAVRGRLFEGDGFAVSYEGDHSLRLSPGYRNLQVLAVDDQRALCEKLAPLGVHLKCLGVAGVSDLASLAAKLPARLAPRICALGEMQRPPLDALHDGVPAWEGLIRWTELG